MVVELFIRIALVHNLFVLIVFGQGKFSGDTRGNKEAIKEDKGEEGGGEGVGISPIQEEEWVS